MKIIHSADWHFREKDHDEIEKCVSHMLGYGVQAKPDLFVISGDITDSGLIGLGTRSARSIFNIITAMLDIAPVAIVMGTPSHDGKAALALRSCRGKYPILVSDLPGQYALDSASLNWDNLLGLEYAPGHGPKLIITQIPQPTKQFFINQMSIEDTDQAISQAMDSILSLFGNNAIRFANVPHIANGHFQVGGAFISETQQLIGRDIEISKSQLKMLNADLICVGHIHKAQEMGDNIFYAGSPTRMNYGETEEKGFYIYEIGDHPTKTEYVSPNFINTPARQMINIKKDYTGNEETISLINYIESMKSFDVDLYSDCYVKMVLTVWQDEAKQINQSEIERCFLSAGVEQFKLLLIRKPRETVRAEKVLEAETLPEKLEAMAELRGETISASILEKAAMLEAGEKEPWKILDNNIKIDN